MHDHVAWCVVGVHQGEEHEVRYRVAGDQLVEIGRAVSRQGAVDALVPPGDIHLVRNGGAPDRDLAARLRRGPAEPRDEHPATL